MPEALKSMLSQHAVRIRQNNDIVGTGFLIVPQDGPNAYVLTAAHVLCTYPDNLNIQFLGIADQNSNTPHAFALQKKHGWTAYPMFSGVFQKTECRSKLSALLL